MNFIQNFYIYMKIIWTRINNPLEQYISTFHFEKQCFSYQRSLEHTYFDSQSLAGFYARVI